jgi:hypothetical protein
MSIQSVNLLLFMSFRDLAYLRLAQSACQIWVRTPMTFEEYLISKKINNEMFKTGEPMLWQEWYNLFEQVSPNSFTGQKLYLINAIRRKYQLKEAAPATSASTEVKLTVKPVLRPKPKM